MTSTESLTVPTNTVTTVIATGGSSNFGKIAKLDGQSNYNSWKFLMELCLIDEDLWDCVSTQIDADTATPAEIKKDQRARAKICLSVEPHALIYVRNATTAKGAWDNLKNAFENKGLTRRLSLLRSLFGVKLDHYKTIQAYITEIMSLAQQLSDISAPLDDEFLGVIMLNGLNWEFDPMVMAIESSGAKITSDYVKGKLLQEMQLYFLSKKKNKNPNRKSFIRTKKDRNKLIKLVIVLCVTNHVIEH